MQQPNPLADPQQVQQWRADTPGCGHCIHLNNAGAALMTAPVVEAMQNYLDAESRYGGYETAEEFAEDIEAVYTSIGQLVGAEASEIALVENATVAVAQALSAFDFQSGDTIITTNVDYSSNQIMLLNLAERFGLNIIRAEDLPEGGVDPESMRSLIQKYHPRLVLMSWVPTNSGLIQNAQAVGKICKEAEVPFLLDACQAVGQLPVDVSELYCDFLAATARKFLRGPRGLGFLYVSEDTLEQDLHPLFPDTKGAQWIAPDRFELRSDARRFENWEFSYALVLGLGAAADYLNAIGVETVGRRARELATYLRKKLNTYSNTKVLDRGSRQCAIVTASVGETEADEVVQTLRDHKINTSASKRHHGVIDMDAKAVETALRVSPHYYNTIEEIDQTIEVLEDQGIMS